MKTFDDTGVGIYPEAERRQRHFARPVSFVLLFFNAGAHCVGAPLGATESLILTRARSRGAKPKPAEIALKADP
jgi:hypothetical protein